MSYEGGQLVLEASEEIGKLEVIQIGEGNTFVLVHEETGDVLLKIDFDGALEDVLANVDQILADIPGMVDTTALAIQKEWDEMRPVIESELGTRLSDLQEAASEFAEDFPQQATEFLEDIEVEEIVEAVEQSVEDFTEGVTDYFEEIDVEEVFEDFTEDATDYFEEIDVEEVFEDVSESFSDFADDVGDIIEDFCSCNCD